MAGLLGTAQGLCKLCVYEFKVEPNGCKLLFFFFFFVQQKSATPVQAQRSLGEFGQQVL